jgi:hypothetical protein
MADPTCGCLVAREADGLPIVDVSHCPLHEHARRMRRDWISLEQHARIWKEALIEVADRIEQTARYLAYPSRDAIEANRNDAAKFAYATAVRMIREAAGVSTETYDGPLAGEVVRNAIEPPQANPYSRHADADGYLRGITRIVNTVTGELVTLPEPIDVHVRDIDRVIDEYQARFLTEWEAGREERERRAREMFGVADA